MSRFPDQLRALRESRGMTQEKLSEALGVAKSTVSMYETGSREANFEMLEAIADHFNVNMSDLLGEPVIYSLNQEELSLLDRYRSLDDEGRRYVCMSLQMAQAARPR